MNTAPVALGFYILTPVDCIWHWNNLESQLPPSYPLWLCCPALIYQKIHCLHRFEMLPSSDTKHLKYTDAWTLHCSTLWALVHLLLFTEMSSLLFQNGLTHSLPDEASSLLSFKERWQGRGWLGGGTRAGKAAGGRSWGTAILSLAERGPQKCLVVKKYQAYIFSWRESSLINVLKMTCWNFKIYF